MALVTGANKGLGKEISRQLAALGMTVLATARDEDRGRRAAAELAGDGDVRFVRLDVTDHDTVRAAADLVGQEFGRLDVLVNNAGVTGIARGERRSVDQVTAEDLRAVLDTNFVGAFAVTQTLLPMLREAGGRVVNLTSALATFARNSGQAAPQRPDLLPYCTSKAAVNMMSACYAGALRDVGVSVYAVSPGYVATDMNNFAGTSTVAEGARVVVRYATADARELPDRVFLTAAGAAAW